MAAQVTSARPGHGSHKESHVVFCLLHFILLKYVGINNRILMKFHSFTLILLTCKLFLHVHVFTKCNFPLYEIKLNPRNITTFCPLILMI